MRTSLSLLLIASMVAIPTTFAQNAKSTSEGQYKTVKCDTRPEFAANGCNQCFEWQKTAVWRSLTNIFDNWTNNSSTIFTAYKKEQIKPKMIPFGSTWKTAPAKESDAWIYATDVIWKPSQTKGENYTLLAKQKIRFWQTDIGASYTLTKTTKKAGEMVGIIKFPLVYHAIDMKTAEEWAAVTHYECVAFSLEKSPAVVKPTPKKPAEKPKPKPKPKEITKTEAGPAETLLLIIAAFFIAFGLMISLRKRS